MLRDDHLWVENVAVSPNQQGQGYGRRPLGRAEQLAAAAERQELRLLTNAAFVSNVELHQRLGYATHRSEPFMGDTTLYVGRSS